MSHMVFATFDDAGSARRAAAQLHRQHIVDGAVRLHLMLGAGEASPQRLVVPHILRNALVGGGVGVALALFSGLVLPALEPTRPMAPTAAALLFAFVLGAVIVSFGTGLGSLHHPTFVPVEKAPPPRGEVRAAIHTDDHTREAGAALARWGARDVHVTPA